MCIVYNVYATSLRHDYFEVEFDLRYLLKILKFIVQI